MRSSTPHEFFAGRVAEAYILHLMATNRRPVYRYESGDIEIDRHFLATFLDSYLDEKLSAPKRVSLYLRLLIDSEEPDPRAIFFGGKIPQLKRRGIFFMNAMLKRFGDMLTDIGGRDENGRMTMPSDERPGL